MWKLTHWFPGLKSGSGGSVMRFFRFLGGSVLKNRRWGVCYEISDFWWSVSKSLSLKNAGWGPPRAWPPRWHTPQRKNSLNYGKMKSKKTVKKVKNSKNPVSNSILTSNPSPTTITDVPVFFRSRIRSRISTPNSLLWRFSFFQRNNRRVTGNFRRSCSDFWQIRINNCRR